MVSIDRNFQHFAKMEESGKPGDATHIDCASDANLAKQNSPSAGRVSVRPKSSKSGRAKNAKHVNKASVTSSGRRSRGDIASFDADSQLNMTEEVLDMLEHVDLTEEETDELLSDAYALNRRLRKQLEKQSIPAPLQRSQTLCAGGAGGRHRAGHKGEPLPPISHHHVNRSAIMVDIYTSNSKPGSKMSRKNVAVPEKYNKPTSATSIHSAVRHDQTRDNSSPSLGKLSAQKNRPVWNERFPYS